MTTRVLNCVFLTVTLFLLPSCSQKNAIVGFWQWEENQSFFEFRADGVFQSHGELASRVTGRYSLSRGGKLKIHITGEAQPKDVLVSINGDEMTFTENRVTLKFHRVEPSRIGTSTSSPEQELSRRVNEWISPATNQ